MRLIARLRLTQPVTVGRLTLSGTFRAMFNQIELTADACTYSVFSDADDPQTVAVEVNLMRASGFIGAVRKKRMFDNINTFFEIRKDGEPTKLLNYIEHMVLLDEGTVYTVPEHCLTLPSAEDSVMNVTLEIDSNVVDFDDEENIDIVAVMVQNPGKQDVILPLFMRSAEDTMNGVRIHASTKELDAEILCPDTYRFVLDSIDAIAELPKFGTVLALRSSEYAGDDEAGFNIPVKRVTFEYERFGEHYTHTTCRR